MIFLLTGFLNSHKNGRNKLNFKRNIVFVRNIKLILLNSRVSLG
jgi:hypothetical protein